MTACAYCQKPLTDQQRARRQTFCSVPCCNRSRGYRTDEERLRARRETWKQSKKRTESGQNVPRKVGEHKQEDERETAKEWAFRVWENMDDLDRRIVTLALASMDVRGWAA